jgi:hypothetical protein
LGRSAMGGGVGIITWLYCFLIKVSESTGKYLPTYSMEQSLSWEANWISASQEIPRIL